jgi:hypothetical protein
MIALMHLFLQYEFIVLQALLLVQNDFYMACNN